MHIAFTMVNGEDPSSHHGTASEKEHLNSVSSLAVYPLTFPMVVGPGTIAALIIYSAQATTTSKLIAFGAVVLAVLSSLAVVLYFSAASVGFCRRPCAPSCPRLMGIILMAIAVSMVIAGSEGRTCHLIRPCEGSIDNNTDKTCIQHGI